MRRVVVEIDWDDLDVVSPAGVTGRRVVSDDWRPAETVKTRAVTVARVDIVYRFSPRNAPRRSVCSRLTLSQDVLEKQFLAS